jgi:hypothetical protein
MVFIVVPKPGTQPTTTALREGDMVVTPRGVGLLTALRVFGHSTVAFGAGGPEGQFDWRSLRVATLSEIREAGLDGVGCNQTAALAGAKPSSSKTRDKRRK